MRVVYIAIWVCIVNEAGTVKESFNRGVIAGDSKAEGTPHAGGKGEVLYPHWCAPLETKGTFRECGVGRAPTENVMTLNHGLLRGSESPGVEPESLDQKS